MPVGFFWRGGVLQSYFIQPPCLYICVKTGAASRRELTSLHTTTILRSAWDTDALCPLRGLEGCPCVVVCVWCQRCMYVGAGSTGNRGVVGVVGLAWVSAALLGQVPKALPLEQPLAALGAASCFAALVHLSTLMLLSEQST